MGGLLSSHHRVKPLSFAPKTKDESNKLRRKNSLNEAIIEYLNAVDEGAVGIQEYVDAACLKALSAKDRKEDKEDPRIAGINKTADEVRSGNMRTLRSVVVQHFKTINRRFQGKHNLNSLLHIACREGYVNMLECIFDDKTRIPEDREVPIEVNARNQRGRTPMHLAFGPPHISWNGGMFGVEPDGTKACCKRPEGVQLESDWARPGNIKARRQIVIKLIQMGADYEAKDIMDFLPIHMACTWGWEDVVKELIENNADLAPTTSTGTTPLMIACQRGHVRVCKLLLAEGDGDSAEVEAKDSQGDNALMMAIRRNCFPITSMLVENYHADVNVENYAKGKPLLEVPTCTSMKCRCAVGGGGCCISGVLGVRPGHRIELHARNHFSLSSYSLLFPLCFFYQACTINCLDTVNLLMDHGVERDAAAFDLLRGTTAVRAGKASERSGAHHTRAYAAMCELTHATKNATRPCKKAVQLVVAFAWEQLGGKKRPQLAPVV